MVHARIWLVMTFRTHHTAVSVSDLDRSIAFYAVFGFALALQWRATDGTLTIAHLRNADGTLLAYGDNRGTPPGAPRWATT